MKWLMTLALTASVYASPLAQKAIENGLKPLPSDDEKLIALVGLNTPKSKEKVAIGKKLYFDPRLSKSGFISCNSCHNLGLGGADGLEAAVGHKWTINPHHLNSPTVYNAVLMDVQFWDGRDPNLEKQAQGPIQAGPEMAATQEHVLKVINSIPEYLGALQEIYGKKTPITFEMITDTIAAFERTLVTPSKYDKFLEGNIKELTHAEQKGLETFIDKGCTSCHNGYALGGSMQTFNFDGYRHKAGDFAGDKDSLVKVPTLRNVALTAPYYHNGKIWNLEEAVSEMARIQLGMTLTKEETASIVTFLHALTGKMPSVSYPILPASTKTTPKPNLN